MESVFWMRILIIGCLFLPSLINCDSDSSSEQNTNVNTEINQSNNIINVDNDKNEKLERESHVGVIDNEMNDEQIGLNNDDKNRIHDEGQFDIETPDSLLMKKSRDETESEVVDTTSRFEQEDEDNGSTESLVLEKEEKKDEEEETDDSVLVNKAIENAEQERMELEDSEEQIQQEEKGNQETLEVIDDGTEDEVTFKHEENESVDISTVTHDKQETENENDKQEEIKTENDEEKQKKEGDDEEEEVDDIVTFEEFKNRMSQDTQNKPQQGSLPIIHKATNNYASSECGAKVIDTNDEAKNPGAILMENKDMYMLNPCSAEIWIVIELCELVSVSRFEIGCFELFSSIPETFAVFTSDSYPKPKWESIGTFRMRNERGIQEFPLPDTVYAKYIKIEMLKHFGSEHYCPISMIRVLGATMMEEYEFTESQREVDTMAEDDKEEKTIINDGTEENESSNEDKGNPIKAATDAILSVIGKAVNGLISPEDEQLLDHEWKDFEDTLQNGEDHSFTKSTTHNSRSQYEQEKDKQWQQDTEGERKENNYTEESTVELSIESIGLSQAMIDKDSDPSMRKEDNLNSIHETLLNSQIESLSTTEPVITSQGTLSIPPLGPVEDNGVQYPTSSVSSSTPFPILESETVYSEPNHASSLIDSNEAVSELLNPSMTTSINNDHPAVQDSSFETQEKVEETTQANASQTQSILKPLLVANNGLTTNDNDEPQASNIQKLSSLSPQVDNNISLTSGNESYCNETEGRSGGNDTIQNEVPNEPNKESEGFGLDEEGLNINTTNLFNDDVVNNDDYNTTIDTNATNITGNFSLGEENGCAIVGGNGSGGGIPASREKSVFVRLSNRINNLETNMTLFGSYLDQISQSLKRNKNRTDDMQKSLDRRISNLNETVESLKGQLHLNETLLEDIVQSLHDLNYNTLSLNQEWNAAMILITILLAALVSIQFLMIAGCCVCWMKHRSDQDRLRKLITDLEKEIKLLNKSHVYDKLNGRKTNHHIPRVNGTSLNCTDKVDQSNDKESLEELIDSPTTIFSSGSLFSSSSQELSSSSYSSLPALNVLPSQQEKWHKVEHKKRRKSTSSRKSES